MLERRTGIRLCDRAEPGSASATSGAAGRTGLRKAGRRLGTGTEGIWVQRRPVQIEEQPPGSRHVCGWPAWHHSDANGQRPKPSSGVMLASTLQDRGGDPESVAVEGLGAGRVVRVGARVSVDHLVEVKRIDLARIHPREPIPDAVEEKPELLLVVGADGLPRRAATRTLPSAINAPGLLAHESDPHPPDDRLARHLQAGGEASTSKHACSSRQCRGAHRSCGRADPTATRPCGGGHRGHVRAQRGFGRVPPGRSEVAPRRARSDGCRRWA